MAEENKLSYFFLGFGIGVAVGILFAPKSGEETRAFIRNKAGEGTDYLKKQGESIYDSAGELVEKSKISLSRQRDHLAAAVEAGKQAYREAVAENSPGPAATEG